MYWQVPSDTVFSCPTRSLAGRDLGYSQDISQHMAMAVKADSEEKIRDQGLHFLETFSPLKYF